MRAPLQNFIRTGRLGPIESGVTHAEVEASLGAPEDWAAGARCCQQAAIWKYGDVEFHFSAGRLWMIFLDDLGIPNGGPQLDLEPWIISGHLGCMQTEQQLASAGISYTKEGFPFNENGLRLTSSAGVVLAFAGEDAAQVTLRSIHRQTSAGPR